MSTIIVNATAGTLPLGFCPTGTGALQDLYNEFINRTQFFLSADKAFYNFGDTAPTPENRVFPWLRTTGGGQPDKWYVYFGGSWLSPYPTPAGPNDLRHIWVGSTGSLDTFDGGSAGVATTTSGPFWEVDSALAAKFPVGVGTFPAGAAVAVTGTGGTDQHTLSIAEMPAHDHPGSTVGPEFGTAPGGGINGADYDSDNSAPLTLTIASQGGGTAFDILPPYYGVYFIKRTIRAFYTV
jgi:hypothetical protein